MNKYLKHTILFIGILCFCIPVQAQNYSIELQKRIGEKINSIVQQEVSVGKVAIDTIIENKTINVIFNDNLSYYPLRKESVNLFYHLIKQELSSEKQIDKDLIIYSDNHPIEFLIPKYHQGNRKNKNTFSHSNKRPFIENISKPYQSSKGLYNRHIALWQSHGFYYEPKLSRWEWQRARIFQTVEDLYTQSFVLPYLVPMLEAAGANVFLPRERDTQTHEIIIDNDGAFANKSLYIEENKENLWTEGLKKGFAHTKAYYQDDENPFSLGTYRQTTTIKRGEASTISWIPEIPESGEYAVYVSYKTLPNSTSRAHYTVHHNGKETEFIINQKMGGGTWIYLGTFYFPAGVNQNCKVTLSNLSKNKGEAITADAVKIGGGYGNIARTVSSKGASENLKSSDKRQDASTPTVEKSIKYPYEVSGYPRFTEAARYWLQWAGIPDSIYSPSKGVNDYTDDYQCRGLWVNYLAGGSMANPTEEGLNIPIDLAFAFHSDAGTTFNDSIIGTLGIFRTGSYDGKYTNGVSRYAARELTDLIQTQIVNDIRNLYHPNWTRRGMWNKSYSEASTPKVPTMLLELLSHQNFADMRYGLDPRFRFTVSRSIYKGILKYLSSQYNTEYEVQPLPVEAFTSEFIDENKVRLTWEPVEDILEPTAKAKRYIVYTKIGQGDFDQGTIVKTNSYEQDIPLGVVVSFKITALNDGGESFPSETLSVGRAFNSKGDVLVINGFTRISAPDDFDAQGDSIAGFLDDKDHGVPYIKDISYIGKMKEFRRIIPWMDDDASGFGDSYGNFETQVIAGNTFDYPAIHGKSILKAGYSFVSCSKKSVEIKKALLTQYPIIDLILGKEKQSKMGAGENQQLQYKTFSKELQSQISNFCENGGSILITGSYITSDIYDNPLATKQDEDVEFLNNVLKIKWRVGRAATMGGIKEVTSPLSNHNNKYTFNQNLSEKIYRVESPDAIEPANKDSHTVLRYTENNLSAGVAFSGAYKVYAMGVPFEVIQSEDKKDELMATILSFLTKD
ncbi:xanthan lyase [Bacteroides coprosuis]|uniref:golvesin C-terminal-like domain-containing protein n=1 Tax=Bacteroides coprosuis TaxID=151276 RepID=UPI001D1D35CC|nr:xanthan lyase [Bacteroides coprosuis]HJD91510.1 xanthan lyase [Bacteroides coprosuis]